MLSFCRSQHHNRLATLWAIHLKACGLSSRAFDALHATGLTMSVKWTSEAFKKISHRELQSAQAVMRSQVCLWSYDNINIPKRVFSMRVDKENHFYCATAGTVWVLPKSVTLSPSISVEYQRMRRNGALEPFDLKTFLSGKGSEQVADLRVEAQAKYRILRFLLDNPAFATFQGRGNPVLAAPPSVHQLPCGAENAVDQFILHTADIEEASYDGNMKVIEEWLRQLQMGTLDEKKKLAGRLIPIVGDQLTIERLRKMASFRHEDVNAYERLDYVVLVVGWFHLAVMFAHSILKQYLGTSSGIGLRRAFDLMNRKNLAKPHIKGPYWHHLDEALWHVAEALSLAGWLHVSGARSLEDLTSKSPEELAVLAERVHAECASRMALLNQGEEEAVDEYREHSVKFLADILIYCDLREAITIGDVGRMEDLLKPILLRFAGGDNPKYTIEVLEVLQGLKREWTPEVMCVYKLYSVMIWN